jgi:diaminopimelate epimerase
MTPAEFVGHRFWKMTGSGNDFVFFDARSEAPGELEGARAIAAVCDRRLGIGADGVVFLESDPSHAFAIRYFNRDGTLAEFCGNASLCSVSLAAELGIVQPGVDFTFGTSSGALTGRFTSAGPQIAMPEIRDAEIAFPVSRETGEERIGFARVGVPHLVVLCDDVERVVVEARGRELRRLPSLPQGANANFVSRSNGGWTYRTYERGVEEETLACGSGSVAVAAMLAEWGIARAPVRLRTRSGADLVVSFEHGRPALAGEGRLVYEGRIRDLEPTRRRES